MPHHGIRLAAREGKDWEPPSEGAGVRVGDGRAALAELSHSPSVVCSNVLHWGEIGWGPSQYTPNQPNQYQTKIGACCVLGGGVGYGGG